MSSVDTHRPDEEPGFAQAVEDYKKVFDRMKSEIEETSKIHPEWKRLLDNHQAIRLFETGVPLSDIAALNEEDFVNLHQLDHELITVRELANGATAVARITRSRLQSILDDCETLPPHPLTGQALDPLI